mgnify:CR=1 FL=1
MITEIRNFLTDKECEHFINLIKSDNQQSHVSAEGETRSIISDFRTSSTCNLPMTDKITSTLRTRIAEKLSLEENQSEDLQGQMYQKGQYFKPHYDYFTGDSYTNHCLASGNRLKTFMIYLNDDYEGGGTDFPKLGVTIKPEKGKAIIWDNMIDGRVNEESLHEGMEVEKGTKFIITSWWRENAWNGAEDGKMAMNFHEKSDKKPVEMGNSSEFKTKDDLPRLTELGFKVVKCPTDVWNIIQDAYKLLQDKKTPEHFPGMESIIPNPDRHASDIMSFEHLPHIREVIHDKLHKLHEEWSGVNLDKSFIYGIRSYNRGSTLGMHVDRIETHHISSIIIIDKDLKCGCKHREFGEDWPLDIIDHNGHHHKVYAEPGDMILYESAVCEHGRQEHFQGTFYRNFYVHYKFKDLQYVGN